MASDKAEKWLARYLETGDAKQSVREVFRCSEKNVACRASRLKSQFAFEIDQHLRKAMISDSVRMYNIIKGLATCSNSEAVKLKAAADIMNRGGYAPDTTIRLEAKPQTRQELVDKLNGLRAEVIASLSPEEVSKVLKAIPGESKQLENAPSNE